LRGSESRRPTVFEAWCKGTNGERVRIDIPEGKNDLEGGQTKKRSILRVQGLN